MKSADNLDAYACTLCRTNPCECCFRKQETLEEAWAKLPVQYLLFRLPDGKFCMVDAMACTMMEGQNAMILQRVTGSDADTPLGAVLRTIEILRER